MRCRAVIRDPPFRKISTEAFEHISLRRQVARFAFLSNNQYGAGTFSVIDNVFHINLTLELTEALITCSLPSSLKYFLIPFWALSLDYYRIFTFEAEYVGAIHDIVLKC